MSFPTSRSANADIKRDSSEDSIKVVPQDSYGFLLSPDNDGLEPFINHFFEGDAGNNSEADNIKPRGTFQVQKNDILVSNSTRYLVMDFISGGPLAKFAKCLNLTTCYTVAVKIYTHNDKDLIQDAVDTLEVIRGLDPEINNMVRFMENFRFNGLSCLVFEMLDKSLFDLINERDQTTLTLNEIRPVIHQLLVALDALKGIGIIHGDLQPENIMLVNHNDQPYRVKLADLEKAIPVNLLEVGEELQAYEYRSPEVLLGLPLSEAVDIWGVGCVMASLCLGRHLFPGDSLYHLIKTMVQMLGQPDDHLLNCGIYSLQYFRKEEGSSSPGWRLRSPEEFEEVTGPKPQASWNSFDIIDLEEAVQGCQPSRDALEYEDTMAFLSLLKSCLHLNPSKRITPNEALKHPFITMSHLLNEKETRSYVVEAHQFMDVCTTSHPEEAGDSLTHTEIDMESDPRTFKTDSQRVSSSACFWEKDSLTESFSDIDGDIESSSDDSSDIESSSDDSSDMESYTGQHSGTRCFSGSDADIETEPETMGGHRRGIFDKTQRDQSPVGNTGDLDTRPYNAYNSEADNIKPKGTFQVQKNDILVSNSTRYLVMDFIGGGAFAKVAKCLNLTTCDTVAVKIRAQIEEFVIQHEVNMLEAIGVLDPEKNNMERFVESFRFNGLSCLVFEMLDRSLFDLINERDQTPLRLNEIRPVIHQLLLAFDALNGIGMIHGDLQPENVMLVNHNDQPYRVKLVDLEKAIPVNLLEVGDELQAFEYRSPEVLLGLQLSEAVDMWGVGCVMAFLCLGRHLFPGDCPDHLRKTMVKMLGPRSPKEFEEVTGPKPQASWNSCDIIDLDEAVQRCQPSRDALEYEDTMAFLSLLKSCLHLNARKRITPKEALKHPFITMSHLLNEKETRSYVVEAHQFMDVCPTYYPDKEDSGDLDAGPHNAYQVQKNDILFSKSTRYLVMNFNGEGAFGKVAQCVNLSTKEMVAVKIHTGNDEYVIQREVYMLEAIRALDPEKNNIVRFVESFRFKGLSCLAFEMLDRSLWDLMKESWTPLRLNEIRPVFHQLLVAFDALKGIGMIHTDLKPDNIMLVNHKDQPYRIKLIDFGLAIPANQLEAGETVQPCGYRAPEVMLGLPLSEAIDMWGVGCVMAFLCFGQHLFPVDCPYHCLATMVQMLGKPEDHLLRDGIHSLHYFSKEECFGAFRWRLKSPTEYKKTTGRTPHLYSNFFDKYKNLEFALQKCHPSRDNIEFRDSIAFLSLLKSCLHLDPSKRITPQEALKHPFITMSHLLNEKETHAYACEANQLMAVCHMHH